MTGNLVISATNCEQRIGDDNNMEIYIEEVDIQDVISNFDESDVVEVLDDDTLVDEFKSRDLIQNNYDDIISGLDGDKLIEWIVANVKLETIIMNSPIDKVNKALTEAGIQVAETV